MNILFLTYQGGPAGSTFSTTYLATGLSNRGHHIWVGCSKKSLLWQLLSPTSVQLVPMEIKSSFDRKNIREIAYLVREYAIDIVNAQSSKDRYTSIFAKWIYKLPCKVVHTRRALSKSLKILGGFYEKGTDKIVAVSGGVKVSLVAMGISHDHIQVIRNGTPPEKYNSIDSQRTDQLKSKYGIRNGDIVIGSVGRQKEQRQILQALLHIKRTVKVIFIGIESQPDLESIIQQYALPHQVFFTGIISNEEALHHYPLFRMKILASAAEGLPQVLLEAMALGVPVIATNVGGIPELVQHQVNGLLFNNNDIKTLAQHIEALINNQEHYLRLKSNGQKTALEDFSIEKTIDQYERFFSALIYEDA
ncbi:MAG: glycosyltransferase family 4 protein [Tunicatimonas sp.]